MDHQHIFQAAPVGLFAAAHDGRLFRVNEQMTHALQCSPQELEGKSLIDHLVGLDAETRWSLLRTSSEPIQGKAFPFRRMDGVKIWARLSARSLRDSNGRLAILGSLEDVTDEWEAVSAMRASESRLRQIHDASIIGIFTWRVDGLVMTANDTFLAIAGYSREDLAKGAIRWNEMTPPEYREADEKALHEIAETGVCKPYNKEYVRKDGVRAPLLLGAACFYDDPDSGIAYVVDMEAKQQAEREVHRLSEVQAAILNALPAQVAHIDRDGKIRNVNASWQRFFHSDASGGASCEVGANYLEYCDRAQGAAAEFARKGATGIRAVLGGDVDSFELEHPCYLTGHDRWFRMLVAPMRAPDGGTGALVMHVDITEAKRTRLALQENEERLRFALDSLELGVWEWVLKSEKLYWSESFEPLHGLAPGSLDGKLENYLGCVHFAERSTVYRELTRAMKDRSRFEQEYRFVGTDGEVRWISNNGSVVYDEAGQPARMLGIVQDVTRRRQEADLVRGLATIVESSQDAIYTKTNDGMIDSWNQGAERIFGYTAAEAIGASVALILPSDRVDEDFGIRERLRAGRLIDQFETVRRRKDGTLIDVSLTASPIYGPNGEVARSSIIARDITERRKLEEQFRQSQKMEAIGQLAGGISHDFNNLLTIILGHCDLMQSRPLQGADLAEGLAEIREAAERAASLTRQMLAFSRRNVLHMRILDLNAIIQKSEKMYSRIIGEDITLVTRLAADLAPIEADAGLLDQALLNLVVNARDAMPQGGRLIIETKNIELQGKFVRMHPDAQPGPAVLLSVTDSGGGIDPAILPRVFEPFFTTKGVGEGTGLGLATVYGIVKQCGGHVTVESELNIGSTFKIHLPAQGRAEMHEPAASTDLKLRYGQETVLIVEDDAGVRRYAREALISLGYTVLDAASGRDAEQLLDNFSGNIDLLLTDVVMPEMSGLEIANTLHARFPQIKTLFMSGYTDNLIVNHGVLQSEVNLMEKPFSRKALADAVRAALEERQNPPCV